MITEMDEVDLFDRIVAALAPVPGVAAIVLGGSRARGTAGPTSDYGIGLYYAPEGPIDVPALCAAIAPIVDDPAASVTASGEWGPWIDGGAWLRVGGAKVDLLYRNIAKVSWVMDEGEAGRFTIDYQMGTRTAFARRSWLGGGTRRFAQVLFARNRRWLIHDKGSVPLAAALPVTIKRLNTTADQIWKDIGNGAHEDALARLGALSVRLRELTDSN